jgi:hypothetical protein
MSDTEKIKPLRLIEEYRGKLISVSKRFYTWEFEHIDHVHSLVLQMSLLSRKFSIYLDSKLVFKGTRSLFRPFQFESSIHGLRVIIAEKLYSYDLYINNRRLVFVHEIRTRDESVRRDDKTGSDLKIQMAINQDQSKDRIGGTRRKSTKALSNVSQSPDNQDYLRMDSPVRKSTNMNPSDTKNMSFIKFRRTTDFQISYEPFQVPSTFDKSRRHHYSAPTKSELSLFKSTERIPPVTNSSKKSKELLSDLEVTLAVRRLNVAHFSEYEARRENYEPIDFSVATPESQNLCKLIYLS